MYPIISKQFKIGGTMPGAVGFWLTLNFSEEDGDVSGNGHLGQSTNPPLNMGTNLTGHTTSVWDIEGVTQTISLTGYSEQIIAPLGFVNVRCTIIIQSDAPNAGLAQLQYRTSPTEPWKALKNLPVTGSALVPAPQ